MFEHRVGLAGSQTNDDRQTSARHARRLVPSDEQEIVPAVGTALPTSRHKNMRTFVQ